MMVTYAFEVALPLHGQAFDDVALLVPYFDDPLAGHLHLVQQLGQAVDVVGAEDEIDVLEALTDPLELRLLLHHAAADADDELGIALFELAQHVDLAVHFPLGIFPDAAGVVEDQVGVDGRRDFDVADLLQACRE